MSRRECSLSDYPLDLCENAMQFEQDELNHK